MISFKMFRLPKGEIQVVNYISQETQSFVHACQQVVAPIFVGYIFYLIQIMKLHLLVFF